AAARRKRRRASFSARTSRMYRAIAGSDTSRSSASRSARESVRAGSGRPWVTCRGSLVFGVVRAIVAPLGDEVGRRRQRPANAVVQPHAGRGRVALGGRGQEFLE